MDFTLKTLLMTGSALTLLALLAGCGLRGGLERPDPIFKDVKPVEQVIEPQPAPEVEIRVRPRTNELGGELPLPAPAKEVTSAPLPDVQP